MVKEVLKVLINKFCIVYMDDVIVFSTTLDEHIHNLREVFTKFKEYNLKV